MDRQRICVVTGSRAEYGLLYWVLHDLRADPNVELQIIATAMHLAPEYGLTVREIEADGFTVTRCVEMLLSSDSPGGVAKSVGLGIIGLSDALSALAPDVVVVLGDRFEILAAAQACLIHKIPLAHIAGGDVTEGAFDESIRHAITKMAQVHFVTNEDSARRVRQMGEDPARVHVVGSPGLDHLRRRALLDRPDLEAALGAPLGAKNLLVTFHPVTLNEDEGMCEFDALLGALAATPPDTHLWFTRPNADTGGRAIAARLDAFAARHPGRTRVYTSLGQVRYLSLLAQVDAVVGNSSSGLYEAPSFGVPTVNVGDRQRGRLAATSVLHCRAEQGAIADALRRALVLDCRGVANPYGDGHSAPRIVSALRGLPPRPVILRKPFYSVA
ncbi:MAG: UDP-N-acetylglucosamine 2-epimerase [Betaproteobacteria bacterium]